MSGRAVPDSNSRGRIIFFVLLVLIGCIALWYPFGTESMGIEERFSSALGIAHEEVGHGHEEGSGFALEGSPVLYALILVLLIALCWIVYRKFGA